MEFKSRLTEWRNILKSIEKSIKTSVQCYTWEGKIILTNNKVVNHWAGSTTSEKDLHNVAEHKLKESANYQKMGNLSLESMLYAGYRGFTFLPVSLSLVLKLQHLVWDAMTGEA